MFLHRCPPIFWCCHHDARGFALLIPCVNEAREWLIGRAVIPEWMKALYHQHGQWVVNLGQPTFDPWPPRLFEGGRITSDPEAPTCVVRPAVIGQDFSATWTFPPKHIRALHRCSTEMRVDGHREAFNPEIQ